LPFGAKPENIKKDHIESREAMPPKKKETSASSKVYRPSKPLKKTAAKSDASKKKAVKKVSAPAKPKAVKAVKITKKEMVVKNPKTVKAVKVLKNAKEENAKLLSASGTNGFKPLPRQGETQLMAFIRDPQCVFTYWEVTPERLESVKRELKEEFKDSYMVLRLFHIAADGAKILFDEIRLEPGQMNRYVELKQSGNQFVLEIGQKTSTGRYVSYAQSNPVSTDVSTYISADHKNETRVFLEEGSMSPELQNYYKTQGYDPEVLMTTEKISSAENLKRLRNINRSSLF
jgi:hypothetical protein